MVLTSKTRLGKRKLEVKEVRREKQEIASKKHDKKCFAPVETCGKEELFAPRKAQPKSDLLKELNDALLEEVKNNEEAIKILKAKEIKHLKTIKCLEDRVENLTRETSPKLQCDLQTQTSLDPGDPTVQIPCRICLHVATCEEELNWHMDDEHNVQTDMYFETDFPCETCGKWCRSEADLNYHIRKHQCIQNVPSEVVKTCPYFLDGCCAFDSKKCWFDHPELSKASSVSRKQKSVKCRFCENFFETKREFMEHRKLEHPEKISACKKEMDGSCRFGVEKCWYAHHIPNQNLNQDPELLNRLFTMMEKFTERIDNIENQL